MNEKEKRAKPSGSPSATKGSDQKTDRPGFDLDGSSDDTHAGSGLGLGKDAFDKPGDRRLPGRRLDNKLTIPRWSGSKSLDTIGPAKKPSGRKT